MSTQTAKWYTRARRFPRLIGKLPDGTPIPFGPFTVFQVLGGAGVFIAMVQTINVWGVFGLFGNVVLLMVCSLGVLYLLGKLPMSVTSAPLTALHGLLSAAAPSPAGTVGGRAVRIAKPHRDRARLIIHTPPLPTPEPTSGEAVVNPPVAAAKEPLPLTSVQKLLASALKD